MTQAQIKAAINELIAKLTGNRFEIKAQGGRVGLYQGSTPLMPVRRPNQGSPSIMTEAVTDSEVEDAYGVPVEASTTEIANDTFRPNEGAGLGLGEGDEAYQLLRARLPQEISDDIVRLIAYNPSAFQDFATIESQEDVIAFNNKYGVELVIDAPQV